MKLVACYGTRPSQIKLAPLLKRMPGLSTLYTRQQDDLCTMGTISLPKIREGRPGTRLNDIIQNILKHSEVLLPFDSVMVYGDTASAYGCALAGFNMGKRVIHLEAGLRTNDRKNPYPEETYRRNISWMADIHLCPGEAAARNLIDEGIRKGIHVVGNLAIDSMVDNVEDKDIKEGVEVLVTLHRRENMPRMGEWLHVIDKLAEKHPQLKFTIPAHPSPLVQSHMGLLKHVSVVKPMPYPEFLKRLCACKMIITDSGGIQEECSYLGKCCLVCRRTTERPECLEKTSFLTCYPYDLESNFDRHLHESLPRCVPHYPYGNGKSAERIIRILNDGKL